MHLNKKKLSALVITFFIASQSLLSQETKLLRQPSISTTHVAFTYGSDVWIADLQGQNATRITICRL